MSQDTPPDRIRRVESTTDDKDSIKGLFEDVGFWGHLYLAGWGVVAAASIGVATIVAVYQPGLIDPGVPWIEGPWYTGLTVQMIGGYFLVGAVGVCFKWFVKHLEAAFPEQMGRLYIGIAGRLMHKEGSDKE